MRSCMASDPSTAGELDGPDAGQVGDAGVEVIAEREVGAAGVVVDHDWDRGGGVDVLERSVHLLIRQRLVGLRGDEEACGTHGDAMGGVVIGARKLVEQTRTTATRACSPIPSASLRRSNASSRSGPSRWLGRSVQSSCAASRQEAATAMIARAVGPDFEDGELRAA